METNGRLRPNTPIVISEVVENEVVLVNFDSGSYYSLAGSGTEVWRALGDGASASHVTNVILESYGGSEAEIRQAVHAFLEELRKEELVVEDGVAEASGSPESRGSAEFEPPLLERFDDMRDMLLLDPIHEVDEAGWPHTRPPAN